MMSVKTTICDGVSEKTHPELSLMLEVAKITGNSILRNEMPRENLSAFFNEKNIIEKELQHELIIKTHKAIHNCEISVSVIKERRRTGVWFDNRGGKKRKDINYHTKEKLVDLLPYDKQKTLR